MKIVNLEVENFMGVRAVEISPDGSVITIGGKNGQGKSSILNAIVSALGGAKELPGVAVREGEDAAVTKLTLSRTEGDLHITRVVKSDGKTTLTIKSADGAKYGKPQQMLDALVGAVGFDPYEFTRLDSRKQLERLRELVGVDTSDLDERREEVYSDRAELNKIVKRLEGVVESLPVHELEDGGLVVMDDLFTELEKARETAEAAIVARNHVGAVDRELEECSDRLSELNTEIGSLERRLATARNSWKQDSDRLNKLKEELVASQSNLDEATAAIIPEEPIRERMRSAESHNEKVRENQQREAQAEELEKVRATVKKRTAEIESFDRQKRDLMAQAEWPVEGLGFDSDGVTYNGRPFGQASSAEQLRVSLAMGMALNPALRVLIIRDGSLIDEDTMAVISQSVTEKDFQLWIERVSASGEGCTVVIEDGSIRGAAKKVARATAKA